VLSFVSIVVPTRNRAGKLPVCLTSLVHQEFPSDNYEIVVVDDGSTDETLRVAGVFARQDEGPAVTVVTQRAQGTSRARNTGLAVARGDPVCFVDDDTEAPPGWLAAMGRAFERYPEADAFGGPVHPRLEDARRRTCPRHPVAASLELGDRDLEVASAVGANMAVRRRAVEKVGAFDDWVVGGDDTEWFGRLEAALGRTMYVGDASLWHRRDTADLRPWSLVWSSFRRGVATHTYFIRIGRRDLGPTAARLVPGLVRTAARERCLGALAGAATQAGYAYGLFRHRHTEPPPTPGADAAGQRWRVVKRRRCSS
jgi:glycosyltransferase involved in cell wall biosynthesis